MRPFLMSVENVNSSIQRFTDLWLENHDMLAAYVYMRVRDFHDAEDVIQEVARHAAGSFDQYDTAQPFGGWLIGIAKRRIADYFRKHGRSPVSLSDEAMDELADAHLDLTKTKDIRFDAMQACLARLSDRHRRAIDLRYGQALSPDVIAKRVGATTTAVNAMIYRIRKALADCINQRIRGRG
ncbi:MAG: sigma-70 family RNA polymerase sigma factor [Planctomycetota bacterium]